MFRELNSLLRKIMLIIGAVALIFGIADRKTQQKPKMPEYGSDMREGFQIQEFDDIW